jgi:hypothetical protein
MWQGRPEKKEGTVKRMMSWKTLILGIGLLLIPTATLASTCDGVQFKDTAPGANGDLVLNGLGLRKATIFKVKVYVAGLYLPEKSGDAQKIIDMKGPWRLELRFVHDVDTSDMKEAFQDGFKKSGVDVSTLKHEIDSLVGMFVDFKEGQTLSFANNPADGVAVELNGNTRGTIKGANFGKALLAISLGPNPPNDELKSGLLGGTCD